MFETKQGNLVLTPNQIYTSTTYSDIPSQVTWSRSKAGSWKGSSIFLPGWQRGVTAPGKRDLDIWWVLPVCQFQSPPDVEVVASHDLCIFFLTNCYGKVSGGIILVVHDRYLISKILPFHPIGFPWFPIRFASVTQAQVQAAMTMRMIMTMKPGARRVRRVRLGMMIPWLRLRTMVGKMTQSVLMDLPSPLAIRMNPSPPQSPRIPLVMMRSGVPSMFFQNVQRGSPKTT